MVKIKYLDADGKEIELEVEEDFANFYNATIKEERNLEDRERYHTAVYLDAAVYEGDWFADNRTPDYYLDLKEQQERIDAFLNILTDTQRRRLELKMDNPKLSFRDLAKLENTNPNAIVDTFKQIQKKCMTFFNFDPVQN